MSQSHNVHIIEEVQAQVFWINLVAMSLSLAVNWRAARRAAGVYRRHFFLAAGFSSVYCVSYVLFLTGVWTRLQWSQVMIIPSLATIVVLWVTPAALVLTERKEK